MLKFIFPPTFYIYCSFIVLPHRLWVPLELPDPRVLILRVSITGLGARRRTLPP